MSDYDSRPDTLVHSLRVGALLAPVIAEIAERAVSHDLSKTRPPELEVFDRYTPKLKTSTYGSDEYKGYLAGMGEGLAHHYAANRHHPEHFTHGVDGMTLVDLIEMLADWKAATERHDDGSLDKSLEIQRERFGIDGQLANILHNTASSFGWLQRPGSCGVAGRAPNGDVLDCNRPASHNRPEVVPGARVHCDGLRDGLEWRDGEVAGFEPGEWRLATSFPARS